MTRTEETPAAALDRLIRYGSRYGDAGQTSGGTDYVDFTFKCDAEDFIWDVEDAGLEANLRGGGGSLWRVEMRLPEEK